jgi:hypothetical protein
MVICDKYSDRHVVSVDLWIKVTLFIKLQINRLTAEEDYRFSMISRQIDAAGRALHLRQRAVTRYFPGYLIR